MDEEGQELFSFLSWCCNHRGLLVVVCSLRGAVGRMLYCLEGLPIPIKDVHTKSYSGWLALRVMGQPLAYLSPSPLHLLQQGLESDGCPGRVAGSPPRRQVREDHVVVQIDADATEGVDLP